MVKLSSLIMECVTALMCTVIGYVITDYFMTTITSAMGIGSLPSYFTSLGLTVVFIMIFFAIIIWVITHAMHADQAKGK